MVISFITLSVFLLLCVIFGKAILETVSELDDCILRIKEVL